MKMDLLPEMRFNILNFKIRVGAICFAPIFFIVNVPMFFL